MADSKRARSWKRRTQPRIDLTNAEPVLYSTHFAMLLSKWNVFAFPEDCSECYG
jgi:hypothetical protein